jgi:hypothetical protein
MRHARVIDVESGFNAKAHRRRAMSTLRTIATCLLRALFTFDSLSQYYAGMYLIHPNDRSTLIGTV